MSTAPSSGPRDTTPQQRTGQPVRRRARRGRTATANEWSIVILLVVGAILSATAFWQATVLGEESSDLTNRARFTEARLAQERSALDGTLAHDRRVLLGCRGAITRRDAAVATYSESFDASSLRTIVEGEHVRVALEGLLTQQPTCSDYDVSRSLDFAAFNRLGAGSGDPAALRQEAAALAQAEQWEVIAAVLFAVVLLAVTLADATARPWVTRWLMVAGAFLVIGLVVAALAFASVGRLPWQPLALLAVVFGVLGGLALWFRSWDRASRPPPIIVAARRMARRRAARVGFRLERPLRWWSELLGAATLVVFAIAVLGFTAASISERTTLSQADERTAQAHKALELGQRSAVAVLAFGAELSELDARLAAAGSEPRGAESSPDRLARSDLLGERWEREQGTWSSLLETHLSSRQDGCLRADLILPWESTTAAASDPPTVLPEHLVRATNEDPNEVVRFIERSSDGSEFCATQAAVFQTKAAAWAATESVFTVALVVLGLAGFLFASAGDADRSRSPRRWLFASGVVGLATGVAVAIAGLAAMPPTLTQARLDAGALAFIQAGSAADCETRLERAATARQALAEFEPARMLEANAQLCTPDSWLVGGAIAEDRRRALIAGLEGVRSEADTAAVAGNLGWGYALQAMAAPDGSDERAEAIRTAQRYTTIALRSEPENPHLCMNRALLTFLAGDGPAAEARYREALNALDHVGGPGGVCEPVAFKEGELRDFVRLEALADLELAGAGPEANGIRELIVGSAAAAPRVACVDIADADLGIRFFPQEVDLTGVDDESRGEPFSAIWYHRATDEARWSLITYPSASTLRPGCPTSELQTEVVLPAGQYRVDLYVDGRFVRSVTEDNAWWADRGLDAGQFKQIVISDLGISAAIPSSWELLADTPGVEVVYGGDDGHVAFSRAEGIAAEAVQPALVEWADAWLDKWGARSLEADDVPIDDSGDWYLGMGHTIVATPTELVELGVGQDQYLVADDDNALLTDVESVSCPGAVRMTVVEADDPDVVTSVWLSQRRIGEEYFVRAGDIVIDDVFIGPEFSLAIPEGWTGAGCPGSFIATGPEREANFLVGRETTELSLADYVQSQIDLYRAPDGGFTDWSLESRSQMTLLGGILGERIDFSWTSTDAETGDDIPVRQTQVYAMVGGSAFYLTFTAAAEDADTYAPELDYALGHFRIGRTAGIVSAVCDGCAGVEALLRQARLDELAGTLDFVDADYCVDITDEMAAGESAAIGCTLPGGFRVDARLFATADDLNAAADPIRALPGAVVRDWFLYGPDYPRTGTTVEWVADGDARFFWTYDDLLITADAALAGGDATRLNNWWSTSGALVRE